MIKLADILGLNEGKKKNESLMSSENKQKKTKKVKKEMVAIPGDSDRERKLKMRNKANSTKIPSSYQAPKATTPSKPKTESKKIKEAEFGKGNPITTTSTHDPKTGKKTGTLQKTTITNPDSYQKRALQGRKKAKDSFSSKPKTEAASPSTVVKKTTPKPRYASKPKKVEPKHPRHPTNRWDQHIKKP